jgi:signal transduction histidine kinase
MPATASAENLLLGLLALGGLLYFGLAFWVMRLRRRLDGRVAAVLAAFAVLAGLHEWARLALRLTLFDAGVFTPWAHILLVGLALLFLQLNRFFLRAAGLGFGWWLLGALGLAGVAVTGFNLLSWPEPVPLGGLGVMARATLALIAAYAAWGVLFTSAALLTFFAYRRTPQPLHRNRIKYWLVVLGLMILGDGLRFGGQELTGGILRVLGAGLLTYVLVTHHLPDVRQAVRWAGKSSIVTVLMALFFAAGYGLAALFLGQLSGNAQWLAGIGLAILFAIALQPFGLFARRVAQRLISGSDYDPGETVREYGLAISNILSLDRLAVTVVNLTRKTLGSQRGVLFLVDESKGADGHWTFHLQPVAYPGAEAVPAGTLRADHSIAHHLRHDHHPLTQYEIDLARDYKDAAAAERAWLTSLKMDVYVPIYAKEEWIGLLALGPKTSRDRYFDDDLLLLSTLADQTAVGLKNARLVEDLVRLNDDLTAAQASLERAHHQLQELDKLKSSFLGAITHELRTPFVNLGFSVQLLEKQGTEGWAPEQREQLAQLSSGVKAGRQLVDNLIAFSTLLSKQGELELAPVNFAELITQTVEALGFMAQRKGLALETDVKGELPALEGDKERLAEAVHHLVQNAIKFTEQGKVTVACWATETTVTVEVKDTGAGIPAERLPELWKSFEQMADPLKRGQEGLGLGLALVKYVVGAHGGEVWAHSTVGVGSTFGFYIPLAPPKPSVEQVVAELRAA